MFGIRQPDSVGGAKLGMWRSGSAGDARFGGWRSGLVGLEGLALRFGRGRSGLAGACVKFFIVTTSLQLAVIANLQLRCQMLVHGIITEELYPVCAKYPC